MNIELINKKIEQSQEIILSAFNAFASTAEERFNAIDAEFVKVHEKFAVIDQRFDIIDQHLDNHDGRLDSLDKKFNQLLDGQDVIIGRLDRVEQEVTFWNPAITRNEEAIRKINKRLKIA